MENSACHLSRMMGIDPPVFEESRQAMGTQSVTIAMLCMLERVAEIRSLGAYLRCLAQKAQANRFSILPMIDALRARHQAVIVS